MTVKSVETKLKEKTPPQQLARGAVVEMVIATLCALLEEQEKPGAQRVSERTALIGASAILSSLELVSLIVEVEQLLEERYRVSIILADERAMSRRNNPFGTVGSLADYICSMIAER